MCRQGMKEFTKAASSAYSNLSGDDKKKLRERGSVFTQTLTENDVKMNAKKIFKNIEKQVHIYMYLYYKWYTVPAYRFCKPHI